MVATRSAAKARRDLLERIQVEGALAGYEAALAVARDPNAAAPARATAAGLLLRAAALLGTKPDDLNDKPAHEMSWAELNEAVDRIQADREDTPSSSVFD